MFWPKKIPLPVKIKTIFNFIVFVVTKNGRTKEFSPSSFVAVVGSGIGNEIRDPGWIKIRIRDTG
jgi:hypothetical protein